MRKGLLKNNEFILNGMDISEIMSKDITIKKIKEIVAIECILYLDEFECEADIVETTPLDNNGYRTYKLSEEVK